MSVLALTAMFRDPLGVIAIYRSDECMSVVFPLIVFSNVLFNLKRRIPQMKAALDQQVTPEVSDFAQRIEVQTRLKSDDMTNLL